MIALDQASRRWVITHNRYRAMIAACVCVFDPPEGCSHTRDLREGKVRKYVPRAAFNPDVDSRAYRPTAFSRSEAEIFEQAVVTGRIAVYRSPAVMSLAKPRRRRPLTSAMA